MARKGDTKLRNRSSIGYPAVTTGREFRRERARAITEQNVNLLLMSRKSIGRVFLPRILAVNFLIEV